MGIGISVFLIAVGAILTFAVHVAVSGVDVGTVGVILMLAGGIGLLWSLLVLGSANRRRVVAADYVEEPVVGAPRRVVRDDRYVG